MVLVGGHLQGKLSLTGLPWNVPAIPGNCVGGGAPTFDGSQFSSSSIGNEFNFQVNLVWHSRSCLVITTIIAMNGSKIHSTIKPLPRSIFVLRMASQIQNNTKTWK